MMTIELAPAMGLRLKNFFPFEIRKRTEINAIENMDTERLISGLPRISWIIIPAIKAGVNLMNG
jgi:hypothetical protein